MKKQVTPPPVTVFFTDSYFSFPTAEQAIKHLAEIYNGQLSESSYNAGSNEKPVVAKQYAITFSYHDFQCMYMQVAQELRRLAHSLGEYAQSLRHDEDKSPFTIHVDFDFRNFTVALKLLWMFVEIFRDTERQYLHGRLYIVSNTDLED